MCLAYTQLPHLSCISNPKSKKYYMFVIFYVFSFGYFEKNIYLCIDFVTC